MDKKKMIAFISKYMEGGKKKKVVINVRTLFERRFNLICRGQESFEKLSSRKATDVFIARKKKFLLENAKIHSEHTTPHIRAHTHTHTHTWNIQPRIIQDEMFSRIKQNLCHNVREIFAVSFLSFHRFLTYSFMHSVNGVFKRYLKKEGCHMNF